VGVGVGIRVRAREASSEPNEFVVGIPILFLVSPLDVYTTPLACPSPL